MSGEQPVLDLPPRPAFQRRDFVVSSANADCLALLDRWPDWPGRGVALHGPAASGKTHLLHLWRERSGGSLLSGDDPSGLEPARLYRDGYLSGNRSAVAVDDADRAPDEALLHLYNAALECGGTVLLAARTPPGAWAIGLADLGSRLRALPVIAIGPPDDELLAAVLAQHFADRQVPVEPDVIAFLLRRIERSFAAAASVAHQLDLAAFGERRRITIPLARLVLPAEIRPQPGQQSDRQPEPPSDLGVS